MEPEERCDYLILAYRSLAKGPSRRNTKTHTYCIILADRPHGSWKRTFLKTGGKTRKRSPPVFLWTANPPWPHPSTSYLRPLNPTASHNNNNNGGLHARDRATEDIEPFLQLTHLVVECESQQQFDLINGPHERFWFPCTSHFHLLLMRRHGVQRSEASGRGVGRWRHHFGKYADSMPTRK